MNGRAIAHMFGPPTVALLLWLGVIGVTAIFSSDAERQALAEEERSILLDELAVARDLPGRVPGVAARLAATDVAIPPTLGLAGFVRAIDVAGDGSGVFIEQVAPLTVSSDTDEEVVNHLPNGTSAVSISIGATGSYEEIMAFADALLVLNRLVVMDIFEINTDEENANQIIADIELRIFTTEQLTTVDADIDDFDIDFEEDETFDDESAADQIGAGN